jgi:DNA repair protein RadB
MAHRVLFPQPLRSLMEGTEAGALTNFFGAPGTGKTNLCMILMIESAKAGKKNIVYIDTEGGFSMERLSQLTEDAEGLMKSVRLVEPKNFKEQSQVIKGLSTADADLIILDSAASLYRLEYADPEKEALEANRELAKQMAMLSNIARDKGIPVVVTSQTYKNWDTDANEIVGGDAIKYWAKAVVFLERTGKMSERSATIIKHRWMPEGKNVRFEIVADGIKPVSGFKIF